MTERPAPIETRSVLLVDDYRTSCKLLSHWLETAGYRVEIATGGAEALAAIERECPDFLITDRELPDLSGPELCRAVRKLALPHYLYTLLLTAPQQTSDLVSALDMGVDDFLYKPVAEAELLTRLRSAARVRELERRAMLLSRVDALSGLLLRRTFCEAVQVEWQRTLRYGRPLSCVMLDLDFFKRVNDTHGHDAGDCVIREVAALLQSHVRHCDLVGRYGGEEFAVALPETTEAQAAGWADRVRRQLADREIIAGDKRLRMTVSLGVAQLDADVQNLEELLHRADQALLCAKQSGRNRVLRYSLLRSEDEPALADVRQYDRLFAGVTAGMVMRPLSECLRDDQTLGEAADFFLRWRINSTPVVDAQGRLAGLIAEKDILDAMLAVDAWKTLVRPVMRPNVICYEEHTPIRTIYEFLCRVSIRRIVIVNAGRPTGSISRATMLRWFRNLMSAQARPAAEQAAAGTAENSRRHLTHMTGELADEARTLQARCLREAEDALPDIVSSVTRMQSLLGELLSGTSAAAPQPAPQ